DTTPSGRIMIIERRFATWFSGGGQPNTLAHHTSAYGEGSGPKKMCTGSTLLKFSSYRVKIFDMWGLGFDKTPRNCAQLDFGASAALSGGKYFTT
ncbi:uncharacterized protein BJ212DRAFT_1200393, partial [Suillus subaureus]